MSDFFVETIKKLAAKRDAAVAKVDDLGNLISEKDKALLKKLPEAEYTSAVDQLLGTVSHDMDPTASHNSPSTPPTHGVSEAGATGSNTSSAPHPDKAPSHGVSTPIVASKSTVQTSEVTLDVDTAPRPKRARTVPNYGKYFQVFDPHLSSTVSTVDAQAEAEKTLMKHFQWLKICHYQRQGDVDKYINPHGKYYQKGANKKDLALGEDFFFDVQEALAYAQRHQG